MKKVLSNLINIDINFKKSNYIRLIKYFLLIVIFNNCDEPQSPSWETQINLPLLDTEYLFSEILSVSIPFCSSFISS